MNHKCIVEDINDLLNSLCKNQLCQSRIHIAENNLKTKKREFKLASPINLMQKKITKDKKK